MKLLDYIKVDLFRCFLSVRFLIAVATLISCDFISIAGDLMVSNNCIAYYYLVNTSMGLDIIFLVLSVLPSVTLLIQDADTNYIKSLVIRGTQRQYAVSKAITTIISSSAVVIVSECLFILILLFRFPFLNEDTNNNIVQNHYASSYEFVIYQIAIKSICASFFSTTALLVANKIKNVFVVGASPLIIYYTIINLQDMFNLPSFLSIRNLLHLAVGFDKAEECFIFSFLMFLFGAVIISIAFVSGCVRNMENE
jgi:hypothetical protein